MLLKLAWRNIWRNKRRTLITAAAVAFAVFFATLMRSMQKGVWDNAVNTSINLFFGAAQVHAKGYADEQVIDKAFEYNDKVAALSQLSSVEEVLPRIENFALASQGDITSGVLVLGVEPAAENAMTGIADRIIKGSYLDKNDDAIIIASGLAEKLNLGLNDTLILISQGYHGVNAAGKYPIKGIFEFALPDLNKRLVYLPLKASQNFYGAENLVTTVALKVNDRTQVPELMASLNTQLDTVQYEFKDWQEMMPELIQARELDEGSGKIILALLYLLIGFGIFGTILMMVKEREYEFGVLTSIGMRREKLAAIIWLETVIVGFLGAVLGMLISLPIITYFYNNPIDLAVMGEEAIEAYEKFGIEPVMQPVIDPMIFLNQALVIFIFTTVLAFFPLWKITRLKPVEAMRA